MRYLCSRVVQRECVLELPLYFAFPLRGNSYLHHRRFRRRAAPSAPLVPHDVVCRIRVGCRSCTVTKPFANRSAVCPVLLRPELHLRRFHRRRCRHIRSACFREFFTCSRVTWPHALRMQALSLPHTSKLRSYRRTTQPSSGPSGSRKSSFSVDSILFCTAVAVAQCLASSALFSRFKWYNLGLPRRADFVAGYAARTSCQRFMPQAQSLAFSVKVSSLGRSLHLEFAYNVVIAQHGESLLIIDN